MTATQPRSPVPDGNEQDSGGDRALTRSLHGHRERLLDATRRNALINYPLGQHRRSKRFVRVVDELPDFLFERLLGSGGRPLGFRGLERDDADTPVEEKTAEFRNALAEARASDPDHLEALRMPAPTEGADEALARIERELRNRVRERLGLGAVDLERKLTPEQAALALGVQPGFELPRPDAAATKSAHADNQIQTLLFEDELEAKLAGLFAETRRLYEEQGIDSLYASFGCLEWYEDPDARGKPLLSPLLLLPVALKRELRQGKYVFLVNGSERDGVSLNRCLAQKLVRDFGLELPELPEDDGAITPEAYFAEVERWLERHRPKWRLRRYVQIGILHFARLVMYEDLAPPVWADHLAEHPVFAPLVHGRDEATATVVEHTDDDGDTGLEAAPAPRLIADADASQHRVVAETLAGRNLAVEGPPGTGKSQTITNLIAAALAEGRTVLFLAEKMAALDVVFNRLEAAGLGPYCLQLHAPGAPKTAVLAGLDERLRTATPPPDRSDAELGAELDAQRRLLDTHAATIGATFGPDDETVHTVLMRARRAIDRLAAAGEQADGVEIEDALEIAAGERERRARHLHELERTRRRALEHADVDGRHPFDGVECDARDPFVREDVLALFAETRTVVGALESAAGRLFTAPTPGLVAAAIAAAAELPARLDDVDREHLAGIADDSARDSVAAFVAELDRLAQMARAQPLAVVDEEALLADDELRRRTTLAARGVGDPDLTLEGLAAHTDNLAARIEARTRFGEGLAHVQATLGVAQPPRSLGHVRALLTLAERIRALPAAALEHLDDGRAAAPEPFAAVEHLAERARALREEEDALAAWFDLDALPVERTRLAVLARRARNAVPGAWILARVRAARGELARAARRRLPRPGAALGELVERVVAWRDAVRAFEAEADPTLATAMGRHARGIRSPFAAWLAAQRHLVAAPELGLYRADALAVSAATKAAAERELDDERIAAMRAAITGEDDDTALVELWRRHARDGEDLAERRAVVERLGAIGFDPTLALRELDAAVERRRARLALTAALDHHPAASALGSLFAGAASRAEPIHELLELRARLDRVPLRPDIDATAVDTTDDHGTTGDGTDGAPDGTNTATTPWYLGSRYGERRDEVLALGKLLERVRAHWERLVEIGRIDAARFLDGGFERCTLAEIDRRLALALARRDTLTTWSTWRRTLAETPAALRPIAERVAAGTMDGETALKALEAGHYRRLARAAWEHHREVLSRGGETTLEPARRRFAELDRDQLARASTEVRRALHSRPVPAGISSGVARERSGLALLRHELTKKKKHLPIRRLFQRAGDALTALQPCLLMSPMSVAQYLPKRAGMIDLLVIDEASQMRPEDAFGAILRSRQVVVVGDPKQLPPTNFFRADGDVGGGDDEEDDPGDVESILDKAIGAFRPARRLSWHYRSRHPMLAAFSNRAFYDGELTLFPAPVEHHDGGGVRRTLVEGARYKRSRNPREAEAVIEALRAQIRRYPEESVGIVALNQPQAELIATELDRLRAQDAEIRAFLERFDEGLDPVFVKNLENVQGDERDAILISTVYGPDADSGKVRQGFGPINRATGWRRLNVLITRARVRIHLITSLRASDLLVGDSSPRGVKALRDYLHFAETGSLPPVEGRITPEREADSPFELEVGDAVRRLGYEVVPQVGVEGFFIDLAVVDPRRTGHFLLGIECDGATWHSTRSARERDRLRQSILENLGWSLHRIWSTDWFTDAERECRRLEAAIAARLEATAHAAPAATADDPDPVAAVGDEPPASPQPDADGGTATTAPAPAAALTAAPVVPPAATDTDATAKTRPFVRTGDAVTVEKLYDGGERMRFVLVDGKGDTERGRVSINTPLGEALLGLEEGDEAEYEAGVYLRRVRVLEIRQAVDMET